MTARVQPDDYDSAADPTRSAILTTTAIFLQALSSVESPPVPDYDPAAEFNVDDPTAPETSDLDTANLDALAEKLRPQVEAHLQAENLKGAPPGTVGAMPNWTSILSVVMAVLQALKDAGVLAKPT